MINDFGNRLIKVLIVDDLKATREEIAQALGREKYLLREVGSFEAAREQLADDSFELGIISLRDKDATGTGIIKDIKQHFPEMELILLVEPDTIGTSFKISKTGKTDILVRPFAPEQLLAAVRKALDLGQMKQELLQLRQTVAMSFGFDNLVGISKPMLQLKETACRLASTDITVLIQGALGTGRELLARTMHHHSKRRREPFVTVDFSVIPETALATELFGLEKYSSSPDESGRNCLLEQAEHGTLFLNEVSSIPESLQPHLAGFLQTFRLDPTEPSKGKKIDVRIIASTNCDLSELIEKGRFNKELFRSLNVIPLQIPTLTERSEDIEILIEYFLRRFSFEMKRGPFAVSRPAVDKLLSHNWPGNVGELENTLRRAAALCRDNLIDTGDVTFVVCDSQTPPDKRKGGTIVFRRNGLLDDSQRSIITRALDDNNWNFTQTAKELGIGRTTLWRKVKKYRLTKTQTADIT